MACFTTVLPFDFEFPEDLDKDHRRFLKAVWNGEGRVVRRFLNNCKLDTTVYTLYMEYELQNWAYSQFSALHLAAIIGNLKLVKMLLKYTNLDVNRGGDSTISRTPLHFAVEYNHIKLARFLLNNGADIRKGTSTRRTFTDRCRTVRYCKKQQETVLSLATTYKMSKLLLQFGADVNEKSEHANHSLVLHHESHRNNSDKIRLFLKYGANVNMTGSDSGETALHLACSNLSVKAANVLLQHGASILQTDGCGEDALGRLFDKYVKYENTIQKTRKRLYTLVRMLFKFARQFDIIDEFIGLNRKGLCQASTIVARSIMYGEVELYRLILDAASPSVLRDNQDVLCIAAISRAENKISKERFLCILNMVKPDDTHCKYFHPCSKALLQVIKQSMQNENQSVEVADILLLSGADPDHKEIQSRFSLIHNAAAIGCFRIINLLLRFGAHIQSTAWDGSTPLHSAVCHGHDKIVKLLLYHGAEVNDVFADGKSALHMALRNGYKDIAAILIDNGASMAQDNCGKSVLEFAIESEDLNTVRYVSELYTFPVDLVTGEPLIWTGLHIAAQNNATDILEFLLQETYSVDLCTKEGITALHSACRVGNMDAAKVLVSSGADINVTTCFGWSAAHFALTSGNLELCKWLLSLNVDCRQLDHHGASLLHIASFLNCKDICSFLIASGCDILVKDIFHHTPHFYASYFNNSNVLSILQAEQNVELSQWSISNVKEPGSIVNSTTESLFPGCDFHQRMECFVKQKFKEQNHVFESDAKSINHSEKVQVISKFGQMFGFPQEDINSQCSCLAIKTLSKRERTDLCLSLLNDVGFGKLPNLSEVSAIKQAVLDYVTTLCREIKFLDDMFEIDVIPTGSSFENCKSGQPDEFDFLCNLVKLSTICTDKSIRYDSKFSPNFRRLLIEEDSREVLSEFCDSSGYLKSTSINMYFYTLLKMAMDKTSLPSAVSSDLHLNGSGLCPRVNEKGIFPAGSTLSLLWTGIYYKALEIGVDLTPAIYLGDVPKHLNTNIPLCVANRGYHVISKPLVLNNDPGNADWSYVDASTSWRVSFSLIETELIYKQCTSPQKDVYITAKIARRHKLCRPRKFNERMYKAEDIITSYILKNYFLKMVFDCEKEQIDWSEENIGNNVLTLYTAIHQDWDRNSREVTGIPLLPSFFHPHCELLSFKPTADTSKTVSSYNELYPTCSGHYFVLNIIEEVLGFDRGIDVLKTLQMNGNIEIM